MDNDVSLHDLVELFIASLDAKDMPIFVLQFLLFFCGAEVPARRPEIPAPGSSGPIFPSEVFG